MNSGPRRVENLHPPSALSQWQQQFEDWRRLIAECRRKPSRRRVHALRVATLRLEARLEHGLDTHCDGRVQKKAAKRWMRQADKLRQSLSEVRETDVHLAKLAGLRHSLAPSPAGYRPRSGRLALRQIDTLERVLREERSKAAALTADAIDSRIARFRETSQQAASAFAPCLPFVSDADASAVQDMLEAVALEFPELDAVCLHDFRKRIKTVRYQAEQIAPAHPEVKTIAADLKEMQDATGAWHDWQALAKIAGRKFRHTRQSGLRELLETLTEESLAEALALCAARLNEYRSGGAHDQEALDRLVQKAPVRRVELPRGLEHSLLA